MIIIIGTLCLSAASITFASGDISMLIAKQWLYKKPSVWNRFVGLLVNIKNKQDAMSLFEGGEYKEIETRSDLESPIRGAIWLFIGTVLLIVSVFL
ncbi:MAG: hypothetical protein K9M36_00605 [Candidatus Pacebacteria bacterium]|nr:hypothetical protein [Candidatus Paceibacterota bacterium]